MNTIDWLKKLISFDTTSRLSNLALIGAVEAELKQHNITYQLSHDTSGQKANLFATLPAQDGNTQGGLILSGHTDVVPVDGQQWDTDPFHAVVVNDRLYGRGACDMKGFIAVVLGLLPELCKQKLKRPVHIALSYDEEIGCRGAPHMIKAFQQAGFQPAACIVGEPTDMRPVIAHKGIQVFRCSARGLATHSSLTTKGCNAIEYSARLINYLHDYAEQFKQHGPFDNHFDVPFTTISTNMIQGGIAVNTIPAECAFTFEFRHLPDANPDEINHKVHQYVENDLLPKMRHHFPEAALEIHPIATAPGFSASEDAAITHLTRKLTQSQDKNKVAYATEAGLFQKAGIPTVVCGPGNIAQAHGPNEYVLLTQLEQCETFLQRMITEF